MNEMMSTNDVFNPKGRRSDDWRQYDWAMIKQSVDAGREDNEDQDARIILQEYGLWNNVSERPDEQAINELYIERT